MTTATKDKITVDPWDYFLDEDSPAQEHVEKFREMEWHQIRRTLKEELGYELGVGQEPHWVERARAVLYHEVKITDYGKETNYGWQPTNPLPIGNAVQLFNYLKKGFRLRASVDPLVDVETFETAEFAEGDPYADAPYIVPGRKADRKFVNWDAYRNYCQNRGLALTYEPPQEVIDRMGEYDYFCLVHDHGFKSKRAVQNHRAYYVAPPPRGRGQNHATLEQMEVKKPEPIEEVSEPEAKDSPLGARARTLVGKVKRKKSNN